MDHDAIRMLDEAIEQCKRHKFISPEAGLRFPLKTIRWLRKQFADVLEQLGEYENGETVRRRYVAYLERQIARLKAELQEERESRLIRMALDRAREDQGD